MRLIIFFIEDTELIYEDYENEGNSLTTKIDCRLIDFINQYRCMIDKPKPSMFFCKVEKNIESTYDKIPIQKKFFTKSTKEEIVKKRIDEVFDNMNNIAFYGTGDIVNRIINYLRKKMRVIKKIIRLVDRDKTGKCIYGMTVYSIENILEKGVKVICIASSQYEEEIYYRIKHVEKYSIKIIKLIN